MERIASRCGWLWMDVDVVDTEDGNELFDQFGLVGCLISRVGLFVFFYNG